MSVEKDAKLSSDWLIYLYYRLSKIVPPLRDLATQSIPAAPKNRSPSSTDRPR